jgi:hypothetical protein
MQPDDALQVLERRMLERCPEFEAWAHSLPAKHWATRDISAARLGWEAARAADSAEAVPCKLTECPEPHWCKTEGECLADKFNP